MTTYVNLKSNKKYESQEQISALQWFKLKYPDKEKISFHIANERKCSANYGNFLQKMGVKKGVPDIFIPFSRKNYHGLFIEIKSKKGKKTKEQIDFINELNINGYYACFCFGFNEIIEKINWYFSGTN